MQGLVDAWCPDKSDVLFTACLDDVCKYLFEIDGKPITDYAKCLGASLDGCISNSWDHEHSMDVVYLSLTKWPFESHKFFVKNMV